MAPIRLALLLCGAPMPHITAVHGGYYFMFNRFLRASLPPSLASDSEFFTLDAFDVVDKQEYPSHDAGYAAVFLSGSPWSTYDGAPWIKKLEEWIVSVEERNFYTKLIGVCFGHQIIAQALGGVCVRNEAGWEVATTKLDLSDLGKEIFEIDTFNLLQMHRDHVVSMPRSFHLLGSSPTSPNQGMVRFVDGDDDQDSDTTDSDDTGSLPAAAASREICVLTTQGHPEVIAPYARTVMEERERLGIIDTRLATDGRRRFAALTNDGVPVVGRAIWRLLGVV